MVEVIKKEPDPKVAKEVICGECGATLRYVPGEVHRHDGSDTGGGPGGETWVNCPNCNKKAIIRSW